MRLEFDDHLAEEPFHLALVAIPSRRQHAGELAELLGTQHRLRGVRRQNLLNQFSHVLIAIVLIGH